MDHGLNRDARKGASVSRRAFFAKLLKGAGYAAPSVSVLSMAHLVQGQPSNPHGMGMGMGGGGGGMGMGMP
jgi:hypothetical protein